MISTEARYADLVIRTQQELPRKLAAYEELIRLIYPQVLGLALGITRDHDAASSVAMDVSIRVLRGVRKLQDPEKYQIWVRTITINNDNDQCCSHVAGERTTRDAQTRVIWCGTGQGHVAGDGITQLH